jgi:hypothetical protein
MPGLPGEEPLQGLDGLARAALALLDVGQKVEELGVVREGAEALLERRLSSRELARADVGDGQARPVSSVRRGIHGLPVVLDRLGGPAGLVSVPAEARVATPQRAPDIVAPAPNGISDGQTANPLCDFYSEDRFQQEALWFYHAYTLLVLDSYKNLGATATVDVIRGNVDQLAWDKNVDPKFKDHHYLEPVPVADTRKTGFVDRWIVYGKIDGEQLFTAKELTVDPGTKCTIQDTGAYGLICVQGKGTINGQPLNSPKLIRFHELTEDEYFCTEDGAKAGVTFENTSETEPLVTLRYFGPEVNPDAPAMGAYRKNKFN